LNKNNYYLKNTRHFVKNNNKQINDHSVGEHHREALRTGRVIINEEEALN